MQQRPHQICALGLALLMGIDAQAADIAGDMRHTSVDSSKTVGGYFELGMGLTWRNDGTAVQEYNWEAYPAIGLEYRNRRFFIEGVQGTADGLNTGFTLYENNDWTIDFLAFSGGIHVRVGDEESQLIADEDKRREQQVIEREREYSGTGLRISRYWEDYVLQFRLVNDISSDVGTVSSFRVGRKFLYRNWNFHSIASLIYSSSKTNQHLWGIEPHEASTRFPEHQAQWSLRPEFEFGATYPLSENWVFKGYVRYWQNSETLRKSPLVDEAVGSEITGSISYVF